VVSTAPGRGVSPRRTALSDALTGLTVRGRAFLTAGVVCTLGAFLVGQRDLMRVGVLLAVLPLSCAWVVARTRYRLASTREVEAGRVPAGEETRVILRLDNVSRLPTGLLLVEDHVPYVLGTRPRFVLDRVEPRGHRAVSYPVRSEVRGRFVVGPLSLRMTDPFGMCELQRSFTSRDTLVVTPRVQTLPFVKLGGEWSGSGESRSRSLATAGEDDVGTRDYRHGDSLHRVHWRSTARYGDLKVRREEQPWQSRCTLLLDTRRSAHRGDGAASSFEWAVSAAASIGVHLARSGYTVRLLTETGATVSTAAHGADAAGADFEGLLLDGLAVVEPSGVLALSDVRGALRKGNDSLLVAVIGALDLEQASELARAHRAPATAVAVLLDVDSWTAVPDRLRAADAEVFDGVVRLLVGGGWRVIPARAGDDLGLLWPQAARGARDLDLFGTAAARP
jgi:uncharacterized protein (DUF58 family)